MARFAVILPILAVVDTGPSTSMSQDQAAAVANTWISGGLGASGLVVAGAVVSGTKVYSAEQFTNAQLVPGATPAQMETSVIKSPLA